MIQSCVISPNSNPNMASEYTLIENICPTDDSVKYYPQMDRKRFSFTFNSKFNESLLFLHCEMSPCSKRFLHGLQLPMVCTILYTSPKYYSEYFYYLKLESVLFVLSSAQWFVNFTSRLLFLYSWTVFIAFILSKLATWAYVLVCSLLGSGWPEPFASLNSRLSRKHKSTWAFPSNHL